MLAAHYRGQHDIYPKLFRLLRDVKKVRYPSAENIPIVFNPSFPFLQWALKASKVALKFSNVLIFSKINFFRLLRILDGRSQINVSELMILADMLKVPLTSLMIII